MQESLGLPVIDVQLLSRVRDATQLVLCDMPRWRDCAAMVAQCGAHWASQQLSSGAQRSLQLEQYHARLAFGVSASGGPNVTIVSHEQAPDMDLKNAVALCTLHTVRYSACRHCTNAALPADLQ